MEREEKVNHSTMWCAKCGHYLGMVYHGGDFPFYPPETKIVSCIPCQSRLSVEELRFELEVNAQEKIV